MNPSSPIVSLVSDPDRRQQAAVERIYRASFPPEERAPYEELLRAVREGRRELYLLQSETKVVGFASIAALTGGRVGYLEYFAVARALRNQGLGSQFLQRLWQIFRERRFAGFILEVEPEDEGTEAERSLRARRIGFYQRNGTNLVSCAPQYVMPRLDGQGTLRMRLMWATLEDGGPPKPDGALLRQCIRDIFTRIYSLPEGHLLLQDVLDHLTC